MSRGFGGLQREIKRVLTVLDTYGAMHFANIRSCFIAKHGGNPENGDCLTPTHERLLKRALNVTGWAKGRSSGLVQRRIL